MAFSPCQGQRLINRQGIERINFVSAEHRQRSVVAGASNIEMSSGLGATGDGISYRAIDRRALGRADGPDSLVAMDRLSGGISSLQSKASGLQSSTQGIPSGPKRLLRVQERHALGIATLPELAGLVKGKGGWSVLGRLERHPRQTGDTPKSL